MLAVAANTQISYWCSCINDQPEEADLSLLKDPLNIVGDQQLSDLIIFNLLPFANTHLPSVTEKYEPNALLRQLKECLEQLYQFPNISSIIYRALVIIKTPVTNLLERLVHHLQLDVTTQLILAFCFMDIHLANLEGIYIQGNKLAKALFSKPDLMKQVDFNKLSNEIIYFYSLDQQLFMNYNPFYIPVQTVDCSSFKPRVGEFIETANCIHTGILLKEQELQAPIVLKNLSNLRELTYKDGVNILSLLEHVEIYLSKNPNIDRNDLHKCLDQIRDILKDIRWPEESEEALLWKHLDNSHQRVMSIASVSTFLNNLMRAMKRRLNLTTFFTYRFNNARIHDLIFRSILQHSDSITDLIALLEASDVDRNSSLVVDVDVTPGDPYSIARFPCFMEFIVNLLNTVYSKRAQQYLFISLVKKSPKNVLLSLAKCLDVWKNGNDILKDCFTHYTAMYLSFLNDSPTLMKAKLSSETDTRFIEELHKSQPVLLLHAVVKLFQPPDKQRQRAFEFLKKYNMLVMALQSSDRTFSFDALMWGVSKSFLNIERLLPHMFPIPESNITLSSPTFYADRYKQRQYYRVLESFLIYLIQFYRHFSYPSIKAIWKFLHNNVDQKISDSMKVVVYMHRLYLMVSGSQFDQQKNAPLSVQAFVSNQLPAHSILNVSQLTEPFLKELISVLSNLHQLELEHVKVLGLVTGFCFQHKTMPKNYFPYFQKLFSAELLKYNGNLKWYLFYLIEALKPMLDNYQHVIAYIFQQEGLVNIDKGLFETFRMYFRLTKSNIKHLYLLWLDPAAKDVLQFHLSEAVASSYTLPPPDHREYVEIIGSRFSISNTVLNIDALRQEFNFADCVEDMVKRGGVTFVCSTEAKRDRLRHALNRLAADNSAAIAPEVFDIYRNDVDLRKFVAQAIVLHRVIKEKNIKRFISLVLNITKSDVEMIQEIKAVVFALVHTVFFTDFMSGFNISDENRNELRSAFTALGFFLGSLTIKRNRPILLSEIDFRLLLIESKQRNLLREGVLFTIQVLKTVGPYDQRSRCQFTLPNPWTNTVFDFLSEIQTMSDTPSKVTLQIKILSNQMNVKDAISDGVVQPYGKASMFLKLPVRVVEPRVVQPVKVDDNSELARNAMEFAYEQVQHHIQNTYLKVLVTVIEKEFSHVEDFDNLQKIIDRYFSFFFKNLELLIHKKFRKFFMLFTKKEIGSFESRFLENCKKAYAHLGTEFLMLIIEHMRTVHANNKKRDKLENNMLPHYLKYHPTYLNYNQRQYFLHSVNKFIISGHINEVFNYDFKQQKQFITSVVEAKNVWYFKLLPNRASVVSAILPNEISALFSHFLSDSKRFIQQLDWLSSMRLISNNIALQVVKCIIQRPNWYDVKTCSVFGILYARKLLNIKYLLGELVKMLKTASEGNSVVFFDTLESIIVFINRLLIEECAIPLNTSMVNLLSYMASLFSHKRFTSVLAKHNVGTTLLKFLKKVWNIYHNHDVDHFLPDHKQLLGDTFNSFTHCLMAQLIENNTIFTDDCSIDHEEKMLYVLNQGLNLESFGAFFSLWRNLSFLSMAQFTAVVRFSFIWSVQKAADVENEDPSVYNVVPVDSMSIFWYLFLIGFSADNCAVLLDLILKELTTLMDQEAKAMGVIRQSIYFRFFYNILVYVFAYEPFYHVRQELLRVYVRHLVSVQPLKVPSFTHSFLLLSTNRLLVMYLLNNIDQNTVTHIAPLAFSLIKCVLQFLQPLLTEDLKSIPDEVMDLYVIVVKVFASLKKSFPGFLITHGIAFLYYIPPTCIFLRNLICDVFPKNSITANENIHNKVTFNQLYKFTTVDEVCSTVNLNLMLLTRRSTLLNIKMPVANNERVVLFEYIKQFIYGNDPSQTSQLIRSITKTTSTYPLNGELNGLVPSEHIFPYLEQAIDSVLYFWLEFFIIHRDHMDSEPNFNHKRYSIFWNFFMGLMNCSNQIAYNTVACLTDHMSYMGLESSLIYTIFTTLWDQAGVTNAKREIILRCLMERCSTMGCISWAVTTATFEIITHRVKKCSIFEKHSNLIESFIARANSG
ncbi:hypothetical protein PCE1_005009 [Barthelona sp. PCE]